jgi:glutaredoxin 3
LEVTVYTTPTCPYCRQVKEYLSRRLVPFREVNVAADRAAAMEMVRVSGQQGVPVTVIDGKAVVGFDRPGLDQLLEWAQRPRLGAAVADAADMAAQGRTTLSQGAYIGRVSPGGAAARAGLQAGDVVIAIARQPIHSATSVERVVARVRPGQSAPLTYVRDGREHETTIHF